MKPNHRYTLTGGTGNDGENAIGSDICVGWGYWPIWSLNSQGSETVQSWTDRPGHRTNLLDPTHTVLNVGIAHDRHNAVIIQHFSTDYVHYSEPPAFDKEGTLRLQATVNRASLHLPDTAQITVEYDPPPKPLTAAQLSDTYSLCLPQGVAWIAQPLPPGWSVNEAETSTEIHPTDCVDPYYSTCYSGPAKTPEEAHQRWAYAKAKSSVRTTKTITVCKRRR